jgi:hypothetical protein
VRLRVRVQRVGAAGIGQHQFLSEENMSPAKRRGASSKKSISSKKSKPRSKSAASAGKKKSAALAGKKSGGKAVPAGPKWIGFLHPLGLEPAQEDAFIDALETTYAADPLQPPGTKEVIYVRWVHGRGRYQKANIANLRRAVTNMVGTPPNGLALLITGSSIAAKAAQANAPSTLPVLAVIGRQGLTLKNSIGGYYLSDQANASLQDKINYLGTDYGVRTAGGAPDVSKMCLLYNGNSEMSDAELTAWNSITNNQGRSVNAAAGGVGNPQVRLGVAMQDAATQAGVGGAILISSDPFFTSRRNAIIRLGRASGRIMCYPLTEYFEDAQDQQSTLGSFFSYGPSLADVYRDIGTWAVNILSGADAPPFTIQAATLVYNRG